MSPQRKVFVATSLTKEAAAERFKRVTSRFGVASTTEEAEFVIFDLSSPPDNWAHYIKKRDEEGIPVSPAAIVPCLFVQTEPTANEDVPVILKQVKRNFCIEPRISTDVEQLLSDLNWIESMLPFSKRPPAQEAALRNAVVVFSRLEEGGRP
jgi:hypothetical protein